MRIGFWADICLSNQTGMGRAIRSALKALGDIDSRNDYILFFSNAFPATALQTLALPPNFWSLRVPYSRRTLRSAWLLGQLPSESLIGEHEVLFSPTAYPIPTRRAVPRGMIHDLSVQRVPDTYSLRDRLIGQWAQRSLAARADRLITVSRATRRDIIDTYGVAPARVHVAHLAAANTFAPASQQTVTSFRQRHGIRDRYVLWVGEIQARKNVARLVRSFDDVHRRLPDVQLVLCGGRGYRAGDTDRALAMAAHRDAVILTGRLSDGDLVAAYTGASVFAFPSLYEGFGLPILESFSCGTPVVASSVSSLPEIVGDAGLLVDPLDTRSLSDALVSVLSDEARRTDLSNRAISRAREFTWPRMANELLSFLTIS